MDPHFQGDALLTLRKRTGVLGCTYFPPSEGTKEALDHLWQSPSSWEGWSLLYCIVLYCIYTLYTELLEVHTDQKGFQRERPREKLRSIRRSAADLPIHRSFLRRSIGFLRSRTCRALSPCLCSNIPSPPWTHLRPPPLYHCILQLLYPRSVVTEVTEALHSDCGSKTWRPGPEWSSEL